MSYFESYKYLLILVASIILWSCAQESRPQGGPRDELPPEIVESKSTPNYQVFFDEKHIRLTFDEFVNIDKPVQSVIISPPMSRTPTIYARGKEIRIEIPDEEELKPNATYLFNFGESIRDFTESNKLKNYSFIFSTGAFIDSLSVRGKVINAFDKTPMEDVLVMLYDAYQDSIVYQERPFYFASTEKDGSFIINNVRSDSFKIFALKDENVNYIYDQENEQIGFIDSLIYVSADTLAQSYEIEVFLPEQTYVLKEFDAKTYGRVDILFTQSPQNVTVTNNLNSGEFYPEISGDSLIYWYDIEQDTSFKLFVEDSTFISDTISVRKLSRATYIKENQLEILRNNLEAKDRLRPDTDFVLQFNYPLKGIDESAVKIYKDSINGETIALKVDSINQSKIRMSYDFRQDSFYTIVLDSAAVESIHGLVNDSISVSFTINNLDNYGSITLKYDSLDTEIDYVIYLKQKETTISKQIIQNSKNGILSFTQLLPGEYSFEFIEDRNKNGRWDPGVYLSKEFSEEIIKVNTEAVKSSWEIDATFYGFMKGG